MIRLARMLRRLADRVDPPVAPVTASVPTSADPDGDFAQRLVDDLILRDALRRSLRRYSPKETIGVA